MYATSINKILIRLLSLNVFWVVLQITGCGSHHQAYPGNTKPPGDIAVLNIKSEWNVIGDNPAILQLDDEIFKFNIVRVEIMPGDHVVHIRCTPMLSTIFTPQPYSGPVKFSVEAKHDYKVYCDVKGDKTYFWIEESTTGHIAGGEKP